MTLERRDLWACLALLLITLGLYSSVRHFEFVDFDDPDYATAKQVRNGVTPEALKWALTSGDSANWFPLTRLTHLLDYQFYGPRSGPPHVVNAVVHSLACVMLFLFLRRATGAYWKSAVVAAVFAWHPLHVESVAWVAERKDVLCAFFWFLTLWLWVRYAEKPGTGRYLLALLAFCLGLLSKPMIVTLPLTLLLIDAWPLRRTFSLRTAVVEKLPFFALTAISSVITFLVQNKSGAVGRLETFPVALRLSNVLVSYMAYLGKTLVPTRLAFWYPYPESLPWWIVAPCGLAILAASAWALLQLRTRSSWSHPWLAIGWLWFLLTLVPVIGLVQVGSQARADRYMYVPMVGVLIALIWTAETLFLRTGAKRFAAAAGVAVCIAPLPLTWAQIQTWRDSRTLFTHAVEVTSANYVAFNNLGTMEDKIPGHAEQAYAWFEAAREAKRDFSPAWYNLGRIELARGQMASARANFEQALRLNSGYAEARINMGVLLSREGRWEEAVLQLQEAVRLSPELPEAHRNLGDALLKTGRVVEAIDSLRTAVRLSPENAGAHNLLGFALARSTPPQLQAAIAELREAIRLDPALESARTNLEALLALLSAERK